MIVKFMESTLDSLKDKVKNPFFGTLLFVWLLFNREFIFNLFFNENYNSEKRLTLLIEQFSGSIALINLLLTICLSLLLLAIIYAALNFSRFIMQFSEMIIKPKILKIFSLNSIVTREMFNRIESERDYYQKKYSEERNEKLKLQRELDESKSSSTKIIDGGIIDGGIIDEDFENKGFLRIAQYIMNNELGTSFEKLIQSINIGETAGSTEKHIGEGSIEKFLGKNIVQIEQGDFNNNYSFTKFGAGVRDYYLTTFG